MSGMSGDPPIDFEGIDPILSRLQRDPAGGFRIGPCRLEKSIGSGGMGRVYRGRHSNLDVPIAVKCLYIANTASSPRQALDRFKREAKLAAMVSHENLIRVYDSGEDQGIHYIVMELVEGETSRARVDRKGKLELFEALAILHGTLKGLRAAHERNLIHRDIKPGNILISREAKIKVADLGLAKSLEHSALDLTVKGSKLGTPRYAAPEQWQDASEATAATDIYAIGAVLYFFITGEDGIQGDTPIEVIANTCRKGFPRLAKTHHGFPADLDRFIAKCTAPRPEDRFQDAAEALKYFEPMVRRLRAQVEPKRTAQQKAPAEKIDPTTMDGPRAPGASSFPARPSQRRFLWFIGIIATIVYSLLLWVTGQKHRAVPAIGLAVAAVIAIGLIAYRRRQKLRQKRERAALSSSVSS
jgi:eukaryotic-like serine/threonine-protein kinase